MGIALETTDVEKSFGGLKVLSKCSIKVKTNTITALIGPNGAGKSTLFNVITGFIPCDNGQIHLNGNSITNTKPNELVSMGLARGFQTAVGFPNLTVLENLMVSPQHQKGESLWRVFLNPSGVKSHELQIREKAISLLTSVGMENKKDQLVSELSIGEIRVVQLLTLLMNDPKILLLDEPASGIAPNKQNQVVELLLRCKREGLTILVIDHNMKFLLSIADFVHVLATGTVIASGSPNEIMRDPKVIDVYLGEDGGHDAIACS